MSADGLNINVNKINNLPSTPSCIVDDSNSSSTEIPMHISAIASFYDVGRKSHRIYLGKRIFNYLVRNQ
jgi:hypothetical protein